MPKVIENVEQKIFDAALHLFSEMGYVKVEMKMISDKVGIGVGTLYNYYGNKKQLYVAVVEKSWNETFKKLENALKTSDNFDDKFDLFIKILYEEMEKRNGIGKYLLESDIFETYIKDKHDDIKNKLLETFKELLGQNEKLEIRIVLLILSSITQLFNEFPKEKDKNIEFLLRLKRLLQN